MSERGLRPGDRVTRADVANSEAWIGSVSAVTAEHVDVQWDNGLSGPYRHPDLHRLPTPPTTTGDTLRAHAEELMSLKADGLLCDRLFNALSDYVSAFPGSDVTGRGTAGIEVVGTGGGCTAWESTLFANEQQTLALMVTDGNLSHPDCDDAEEVFMGLYLRRRDGEDVLSRWASFGSVAEALAAVERGFSGVVWTEDED